MHISVQYAPFDMGKFSNDFASGHREMGGIVIFTGVVRDLPEDPLEAMEIEHYPGMTQAALEAFALQAKDRFSLGDVMIIHRYGTLYPGEQIMMVGTAAKHRNDAFAGAQYLMDYLKSRAPFWKREITAKGSFWVEAKASDEDLLSRW